MQPQADSSASHSYSFLPAYSPDGARVWPGYLAFAYDLTRDTRPALLTAVGDAAESYFACCQAVREAQLPCVCHAALAPPPDAAVRAYNAAHYAAFSHLPANVPTYTDGSIDLLLIQADQARELFATWAPRVRSGGVVLINGIDERDTASDAWQLWEQLADAPERFAFHHAGGLGLWRKPGGSAPDTPLLKALLSGDGGEMRRRYEIHGNYLEGWKGMEELRRAFQTQIAELNSELLAARHERIVLETELTLAQLERNEARREAAEGKAQLAKRDAEASGTEAALQSEVVHWKGLADSERQRLQACTHSLSWRITAPLRGIMAVLRGQNQP